MDSPPASLVVKVTCGTEALERLNQGFTVAATALAAAWQSSILLTSHGTAIASPPSALISAAMALIASTCGS